MTDPSDASRHTTPGDSGGDCVEYGELGALVVGGASGVGLQSARRLAEAGVPRIVPAGRRRNALDDACEVVLSHARDHEVTVAAMAFDAADPAAARVGIEQADEALGGIDVLVSSVAGDAAPELLHDIRPDDISSAVNGLLLPPLITTRMVLPSRYARGRGSIVLLASDAAKAATPGESVIGAAMAGIVMLGRTTALEAKRYGVRVNTVTPSMVTGTPTTERLTSSGFSAHLFATASKQAHLGDTEPDDVAATVAFLAGPHARRITGQGISVTGGISAA